MQIPKAPRILILTVPHGASHDRAAHALGNAFLAIQPDMTVETIDALAHCKGWFRAYYNSYQIPLKYWPAFWGWIEGIQHRSKSTEPGWLYLHGAQPLFQFIKTFNPDVLVATEVGVLEIAAMMKRNTGAKFILVGAPTGVDVDMAWAQAEVDLYVVAPGSVSVQLTNSGVPDARILECGMPVHPFFTTSPDHGTDRRALRLQLGMEPDVPLLLVLFGGAGFGNPQRILPEIRKLPQPLQVVLIAGRNPRLEKKVVQLAGGLQHRVFGWVENTHEWMSAADILLSKPGASTIIEAINSGLPIVAFDPLPGGERRTCDWLEKQGTGLWARKPEDLNPIIRRLLEHKEELQSLRGRTLKLARPRAAYDAAAAILKLVRLSAQVRMRSGS